MCFVSGRKAVEAGGNEDLWRVFNGELPFSRCNARRELKTTRGPQTVYSCARSPPASRVSFPPQNKLQHIPVADTSKTTPKKRC
jgi:hypothetical protein